MRFRLAAENLEGAIAIKFLTVLTLFILALAQPAPVSATLKFKVVENQLIVTGPLESTDAWYFNREIDKHPKVDTVVLRMMPGGKIEAMEKIATTVEEKKLNTVVSGSCVSACAHIFLAGERRQFSDDFPLRYSRLSYHGIYHSAGSLEGFKGSVPTNSERWYVKRTEGKLPAELVLEWLNFDHASGFAHFYHPKVLEWLFPLQPAVSFMCDGRMPLKKCKRLTKTALDYGIVTSDELAHVKDTPFWKPDLYKQTDIPVSALLDGSIISDSKKGYIRKYLENERPGKAIALSRNGRWLYWRGRLDLGAAIAFAILRCERKAKVKCHVIALGDKLIYTPKQIEDLDFGTN